jgi:hypothetical protein
MFEYTSAHAVSIGRVKTWIEIRWECAMRPVVCVPYVTPLDSLYDVPLPLRLCGNLV